MKKIFPIFLVLCIAVPYPHALAAEVLVAVSANFSSPMAALQAKFTAKTGHKLVVSYGATEKLYTQIENKAPFEVFLSADQEHPDQLIKQGLALADRKLTYAIGRLVLWSPKIGMIDSRGAIMKSGHFSHIALANPKLAPYGLAAQRVLQKIGLWEILQPQIVLGENVAQAFQFVTSGNAELGFIAFSQIQKSGTNPSGSYWLVPQDLYPPIKQDAIVLKAGEKNPVAAQFLDFLKSETSQATIVEFGYDIVSQPGS